MTKCILLIFSLLVIISCSKEKDQEVVRSYISAHNNHDIKKVISYLDENIVFELKGVWIKNGLSEMQDLEEWDATLNSNLKLENISSKKDSVFCRIVENSDWFRAVGILDLVHDPVIFIINNGKIKNIIGYPSEKIGKEIGTAIGKLYQWSEKTQDSTINELIRNGQFEYSAITAKKWLVLFKRRAELDSLK